VSARWNESALSVIGGSADLMFKPQSSPSSAPPDALRPRGAGFLSFVTQTDSRWFPTQPAEAVVHLHSLSRAQFLPIDIHIDFTQHF